MQISAASYSVSSLASHEVNESFLKAKEFFHLLIKQKKTSEENYILKNVAHVTLKSLFYLSDAQIEQDIARSLQNINFSPVEIIANTIKIFNTEKHGNIVVAIVEKTPELVKLHADICEKINNFSIVDNGKYQGDNFNPHLSILYFVPDYKLDLAVSYVKQNILPIRYSLRSFIFLKDVLGVKNERMLIREYFANER